MVGTLLIVLLPFGLSGAIWAWIKQHRFISVITIVANLINLFGLAMTSSRGAWLGFGLTLGYTAYFGWRFRPRQRFSFSWLVDLLTVVFTLTFFAGVPLALTLPEF